MKNIILASKSPRRKELLEKIGLKFEIVESDYEEIIDTKLDPHELVKKFSLEKAKAVFRNYKDSIIIAADTIVVCDGKVLGKPRDKDDAKEMLEFLSGKTHVAITGFTIMDGETKKIVTQAEETKVSMRKINPEEVESYLNTKEPYDKAGGYAIQGIAKKFINKIEGDLPNAIGLPIFALVQELKKFDVEVL